MNGNFGERVPKNKFFMYSERQKYGINSLKIKQNFFVLGNESTSALARVRFASTIE
jgi:hypothetical protein